MRYLSNFGREGMYIGVVKFFLEGSTFISPYPYLYIYASMFSSLKGWMFFTGLTVVLKCTFIK